MKKKIFFVIILSLLFSGKLLHAQQWHFYYPTSGYDINSIGIPSPGVIAIGGGFETRDSVQIMFQSPDYGLTWYENPNDGPAPWNRSIAFSNAINGFGVGYGGRIITTYDAGRNWIYPATPINRDLNKIVHVAGTYYVAGGNKARDSIQTILKSTDNGYTWDVMYDVYGPWLKSLFFTNTLNGIAVGDNGVIITTANGGNTWTSITPPVQRDFNAITFINADTGYIVGGTPSGLCRRTILRTVNGGSNWSVLIDNVGGILKDISFADAQVGYTVGDSATVLKTTDGGLNWAPIVIDTNLNGNESFNTVKFENRNFGAIGGKAGVFYVYLDRHVEVFTLSSRSVGSSAATLLGGINTHSKNANYSFVYSNSVLFTSPETTPEIHLQNDSLLLVSENIQGLTPNTTYYYYLKATTASDTINGDTLHFFTGINPSFIFQTTDATTVLSESANLNGFIYKFPEPVNLFFEYGTSPAFDTQVQATPAYINDTLMHSIQTNITGFQANRRYFFRLKGVTGTHTYYGDTKIFYSVSLPWLRTESATNITLTSAQLNGTINNNGLPTSVKFEYGLTPLYGNEVNATPDSTSGTGFLSISYLLNGLSTATTYHFRLKAINTNGTCYSEDMTFIAGGPSVSTKPASDIGLSSVQLNGIVNGNNYTTANNFEWGTTLSFGNEVSATPGTSTGNINTNISCSISGLSQNTLYYYRAKATNAVGTNFGNVNLFTTGTPPLSFTKSATEITLNSARLNGAIDAGGIPTSAKFEYGLTIAYGNETDAIPDSVSSPGIVSVLAFISGLTPNTTYHFRLKASNSDTTHFGNDMIFYTGFPEIPNFDFESWTSIISTKLVGWDFNVGKITRYTPSCHNNYAVKIENDTLYGGAILIGNSNDMGQTFIGGTPFNARPDSLIGCFNYFIPDNDTALVVLVLKKQGVIISNNWFKIYGNSSGNYTDLKFPIQYSAAGNSDSLIIVMTVTDIRHMSQITRGGYLIVDHLRFTGTAENIPNHDFENWDTLVYRTPDNWFSSLQIIDPNGPNNFPVTRTADAQHGNWAVLVQNYLLPGDTLYGWLNTSKNWNNLPSFKVNMRHRFFTGYLKWLPQNNENMNINVTLFKNHIQVGRANFQAPLTISDYTPFSVEISYINVSST